MANIHISRYSPSRTRGKRIRKGVARTFLGLLVMAVGVGYLGNHLDFCPWENFTLFFPGWGSLFLIIPAIYFFICRPTSLFWPIIGLTGVLVLLANQDGYGFGKAAAIVLAIAVIFVGLRILLSPLFRRIKRKKKERFASFANQTDTNYSVRFGERTVALSGQSFRSATLDCSFGELNLDLRGALMEDPAVIDARCSFGEIHISLPANVKVELHPSAVLGDVSNMYADTADSSAPTLYINAECSFGEIVVR